MMSVSYRSVGRRESTDEEEADGLLNGPPPASVRIESYIPARKRTVLFDVGILLCILLLFGITCGVIAYFATRPTSSNKDINNSTGWVRSYKHYGSESVMRLIDVNGDGSDDPVFGLAQLSATPAQIYQATYCTGYKHGCLAAVQAVDGRTGNPLWNISTYNEIFVLNCGNIDINRDGKMDCVGAGRRGTFTAFDPYAGHLLWPPQNGSEPFIEYAWNIYNPVVVDDITDDGVSEVLLSHGGDPDFPPENKSRYPGRLLLMDGAKGHLIGRYINMPDGKETYNSPVLHTDHHGEKYLLIGTGGETVGGSLFIARMKDLFNFVQSKSKKVQRIQNLKQVLLTPFFSIYKSEKKGVMVPVVLADVNQDSSPDIIVTGFDGTLLAYDGNTFQRLWMFEDDQAESYTTPAIGYFNNDDYLDIMMHWNYGLWPDYNKSVVMVHSGKDGRPLWMFNTTRFSMTSDLVIKTKRLRQDMFVFRVQGRQGPAVDYGAGVIHGVDPQRNLQINKSEDGRSCGLKNYDILASEVFIVDWETRKAPRRVFRRDVDKYYYDALKEAEAVNHQHLGNWYKTAQDGKYKSRNKCAIMEQSSRTTGALGDTNNDGDLDLVLTFNAQGIINDMEGNYLRPETSVDLVVMEIEKDYNSYPFLTEQSNRVKPGTTSSIGWKPKNSQIWTGYMGATGLSIYEKH